MEAKAAARHGDVGSHRLPGLPQTGLSKAMAELDLQPVEPLPGAGGSSGSDGNDDLRAHFPHLQPPVSVPLSAFQPDQPKPAPQQPPANSKAEAKAATAWAAAAMGAKSKSKAKAKAASPSPTGPPSAPKWAPRAKAKRAPRGSVGRVFQAKNGPPQPAQPVQQPKIKVKCPACEIICVLPESVHESVRQQAQSTPGTTAAGGASGWAPQRTVPVQSVGTQTDPTPTPTPQPPAAPAAPDPTTTDGDGEAKVTDPRDAANDRNDSDDK